MTDQMDRYLRTLDFVAQSAGDKAVRQDTRPLETTIRVGVVYAVRCPDAPTYFRTVLIRPNEFSSSYQALITNPVAGSTPGGMEVVSQEQVFRRIRELNATTTTSSLDAFPFKGSADLFQGSRQDLVTQNHKTLQRRS